MSIKKEYDVIEISKNEAKKLVTEYHYLGGKGFRYKKAYGLRNRETKELVGACVFHNVSAPETVKGAFGLDRTDQDGIYELGRLVLRPSLNGGNYTSYLLGRAMKLLRKSIHTRAIITYATSDRHTGAIYQATNYTYYGLTAPKKDFYVNGRIQERGKTKGVDGVWVNRPQKHRYAIVYDNQLDMLWDEQKYPKEKDFSNICYGCLGDGQVISRGNLYVCPICTK